MKKTMVYLEDTQFDLLRRLGKKENKSLAALIRESVAGLLNKRLPKKSYQDDPIF